jgi:hypothetical protein
MAIALEAVPIGIFFAILLLSGAYVFGSTFGGPMRGAVTPLLIVPLLADWGRWIGHLSNAQAAAGALALYALAASGYLLYARPRAPFAGMDVESRKRWIMTLGFLLIVYVALRIWIFTGNALYPSDDVRAGYKCDGLVSSVSWPTAFPEAPELPMGYYYYAFIWPAMFFSWFGVPVMASWWVTAIVLCVAGVMLVMELILPYLRSHRDFLLALFIIAFGCDIAYLPAIAHGLGPKLWYSGGGVLGILGEHYGLYLWAPAFVAYTSCNSPFMILEGGLLLIAVVLLCRLALDRRLSRAESTFVILVIASLPGYCTFDLIGFVLSVVPVLSVAALVTQKRDCLRRWFAPLAAIGAAALALCLPILLVLLRRTKDPGHLISSRPFLIPWLKTGLPSHGFAVAAGLLLAYLVGTAMNNLTAVAALFSGSRAPLSPFTRLLLWIFGIGTFLCLFGVTEDFVGKFDVFLCMTGTLAYFTVSNPPKWCATVLFLGVVGPGLCVLNSMRADIVSAKLVPVWKPLEQLTRQTDEVVLYDIPRDVRDQLGDMNTLVPYFSEARFIVPVDQIDLYGHNYVLSPSQLETLPPTATRVRDMAKGSPTYLLLRSGTAPPAGERLYTDSVFSIDRVKIE